MRNVIPNFPDIDLQIWTRDDGETVDVQYVGGVRDIEPAGITTGEILAKRPRKGPRPRRRDADGDKIDVHFWNVVHETAIVRRVKVTFRWKLLANAMKLPGVAAAWMRRQEEQAESEAEERRINELRRGDAAQDPEFHAFLAVFQQLQPSQQRAVESVMRGFKSNAKPKPLPRLRLVVDNTKEVPHA
jgi:hypothetical protein